MQFELDDNDIERIGSYLRRKDTYSETYKVYLAEVEKKAQENAEYFAKKHMKAETQVILKEMLEKDHAKILRIAAEVVASKIDLKTMDSLLKQAAYSVMDDRLDNSE